MVKGLSLVEPPSIVRSLVLWTPDQSNPVDEPPTSKTILVNDSVQYPVHVSQNVASQDNTPPQYDSHESSVSITPLAIPANTWTNDKTLSYNSVQQTYQHAVPPQLISNVTKAYSYMPSPISHSAQRGNGVRIIKTWDCG